MADRGIIFSAPMILALLAGRKTQTRRLIKPLVGKAAQPGDIIVSWPAEEFVRQGAHFRPAWRAGDRLYVRESFRAESDDAGFCGYRHLADDAWHKIENTPEACDLWLEWFHYSKGPADRMTGLGKIIPSIHMPRWASRLWLSVTDVRIERLQDISREDAAAEGHERVRFPGISEETHLDAARDWFMDLWDSLHAKPGMRWADNPWIIRTAFDVHKGNIDRDSQL